MNLQHFRKIWTATGIVLIYYSINSWIVSQGGEPVLDVNLIIDPETSSSANVSLIALYVCSTLLLIVAIVGVCYAKRSSGNWAARIPTVWLDDLDISAPSARLWQGTFLFLFLLLPLASLFHFFRSVLDAAVIHRVEGAATPHFAYQGFSVLLTNDYSLGENGVTYFPFFSPVVGGIFLLAATLSVAWNLIIVFFASDKAS